MPERQEAVVASFRRKRTRHLVVLGAVLVSFLYMAVTGGRNTSVGSVLLLVMFAALLFNMVDWRCPACDRYLGKTISPAYCSKCGAPLR